jgi:hypothetical protein
LAFLKSTSAGRSPRAMLSFLCTFRMRFNGSSSKRQRRAKSILTLEPALHGSPEEHNREI